MKAELENLVEAKRTEVVSGATVLCRKMENHLMELRSMVQFMSDMIAKANDGHIVAEEATQRYLSGLHRLMEVAGQNDLVDGMLAQIKRRSELEALKSFSETL